MNMVGFDAIAATHDANVADAAAGAWKSTLELPGTSEPMR